MGPIHGRTDVHRDSTIVTHDPTAIGEELARCTVEAGVADDGGAPQRVALCKERRGELVRAQLVDIATPEHMLALGLDPLLSARRLGGCVRGFFGMNRGEQQHW